MKQELLNDLQRLLKCPIPKVEYAGEGAFTHGTARRVS